MSTLSLAPPSLYAEARAMVAGGTPLRPTHQHLRALWFHLAPALQAAGRLDREATGIRASARAGSASGAGPSAGRRWGDEGPSPCPRGAEHQSVVVSSKSERPEPRARPGHARVVVLGM
jgi:hypothetical protein